MVFETPGDRWRVFTRVDETRSYLEEAGCSSRTSFQTSGSMLLPATSQSARSCTKMLAAWRGAQGESGNLVHFTPSGECQTSLRFWPEYPSRTHNRSSKTATS